MINDPLHIERKHMIIEDQIEQIYAGEDLIAIIVRVSFVRQSTTFLTSDSAVQQVGLIVYPAGGCIAAHRHPETRRVVHGTPETLFVRSGAVEVDLYDDGNRLARTVELHQGDVIILISGGHGLRVLEDCSLLEVKQGPYLGTADKTLL
jgi:quercetin dioxygenase-like cupin family protein